MEDNSNLLTILLLIPVFGGIWIARQGADDFDRIKAIALRTSLATAFAAGAVLLVYLWRAGDEDRLLMVHDFAWLQVKSPDGGLSVDLHYKVGLDGISVWLVMLTAFLLPIVVASSFTAITERVREYYAAMLMLGAAMIGVFIARDLLLFYVFFEFTLVPMFLIIGIWGGSQKHKAAAKFFIYTMAGGMLTFAGILYIAWTAWSQTGTLSFDLDKLYGLVEAGKLGPDTQYWLFLAFFAGFAIKTPLFPVHTWLPLAHTEAPTGGSVILAAVLLKLGTYGFLRFSLPLLPAASVDFAPMMAGLGICGIIYGALAAWVQEDVKKLVAYSSVSHLGFCILGMFSVTAAGLTGSLLYMINHGLSTGALFLVVGMIYERYHTRQFSDLGGLARRMPILSFFLVLFTLSSIGLPGLNGFVSEYLVLLGVFTGEGPLGPGYAVAAALGIVLGAVYMLYMCGRVLFGPIKEPNVDSHGPLTEDLTPREVGVLAPIALLVVLLGVFPGIVTEPMQPAARKIVKTVHANSRIGVESGSDARLAALAKEALDRPLQLVDLAGERDGR